jgi:hypothetical protein
VEEKSEQYKANLEKPTIVLEEYPQKEYTLPNYQINHTDPSGAAGLFSNFTINFGIKARRLILSLVI